MKNFFHLILSVVLGSFLGYGLYYKILKKDTVTEANNIAIDELFFADNIAFEKKQQEMLTFRNTRTFNADTLQVNAQFFEKPQPTKASIVNTKPIEAKSVKIIEAVKPIEVSQIQQPKTISIPVSKITAPDITETASIPVAPSAQEISVSTITADSDGNSQEQSDKKRFLFFSKKNRNN